MTSDDRGAAGTGRTASSALTLHASRHAARPSWRIFEHTRSRFIGMLMGRAYKSSVLENSSPFANALAYSRIELNRVLTTAVARPGRVSPR